MQVEIFEHSVHLLNSQLSTKIGCAIVFRRAARSHNLLTYLVETCSITELTNESLEKMGQWQNARMCRTSTKATRIKKLLETTTVQERCSQNSISLVLKVLIEQEERKKKKKEAEEEKTEQALPVCYFHILVRIIMSIVVHTTSFWQGEIDWEELQDDPATKACRELLEQLDEEAGRHFTCCKMHCN